MREYLKPFIEDEEIELEDVIAASNGGAGNADSDGNEDDIDDIWPGL